MTECPTCDRPDKVAVATARQGSGCNSSAIGPQLAVPLWCEGHPEEEQMTAVEQAPPGRPDLAAYNTTHRADFCVVVKELAELLGLKLTAYLAGANDTRTVRSWIDGSRAVRRGDVEPKLRLALHAALLIADEESPRIAQAWFQGLNPHLGDRSAARLLREGDHEEVGPQVLAAARAFAAGG
jgi:hypothetical protein